MDLLAPRRVTMPHDHALTGPGNAHSVERGLAGADWHQSSLDRRLLKELMRRSDGPAIRDAAIWLGLLVASGALLWGTRWCVPFVLVHGVLPASAADPRRRECGQAPPSGRVG